eukprot:8160109-Pyramimonas_sp.AAC.1
MGCARLGLHFQDTDLLCLGLDGRCLTEDVVLKLLELASVLNKLFLGTALLCTSLLRIGEGSLARRRGRPKRTTLRPKVRELLPQARWFRVRFVELA